MEREEAIKGLKSLKEVRRKYGDMQTMKDEIECLDMAIKALEKEPILDKIEEEIQKLRGCSCSCSDGIIDDVEDILDKYKVESEE